MTMETYAKIRKGYKKPWIHEVPKIPMPDNIKLISNILYYLLCNLEVIPGLIYEIPLGYLSKP